MIRILQRAAGAESAADAGQGEWACEGGRNAALQPLVMPDGDFTRYQGSIYFVYDRVGLLSGQFGWYRRSIHCFCPGVLP